MRQRGFRITWQGVVTGSVIIDCQGRRLREEGKYEVIQIKLIALKPVPSQPSAILDCKQASNLVELPC